MESVKIREWIEDNIGYGSGSGYGCVDGDGSGDGSGSGSGYGYGYGDGSGYGSGSGYGYGYGSGYGDGSGDGSGSGSGFGDVTSFAGDSVNMVDNVPTIIDHVHGNAAKVRILMSDFTTKDCYVVKNEDGILSHGDTLR